MDVLTVETTAVNCKNLFNYCENNPINAKDSTGAFWDTLFDVVSLAVSVVDVFRNPVNMQSLLGLAGDVVDLCPFVSGVGEAIKGSRFLKKFGKAKDATKAAGNAHDVSKATTKLDNVVESGSTSNVSRTRWGAEHGKGNVKHNNAIETELDTAFMDGATDLRKNRVQRDVNGNRVYAADGTYTRPDASYVLNGKRYNTNYISNYMLDDIDELNRELDAFRRMVEADPDAITRLEFDY